MQVRVEIAVCYADGTWGVGHSLVLSSAELATLDSDELELTEIVERYAQEKFLASFQSESEVVHTWLYHMELVSEADD